jgi:hypothetical protein
MKKPIGKKHVFARRRLHNGDQAIASCVVSDSAGDPGLAELLALWEPLFSIMTPGQRAAAEAVERVERNGMFAWGVRSGYFLWVREHPGERPTKCHLALWIMAAE